jgi:hypothetical protein
LRRNIIKLNGERIWPAMSAFRASARGSLGSPDDRRGWLCHPPHDLDGDSVAQSHKSFWELCGGIADVLTNDAWLWEDDGLEVSINPDEYYAVAVEASGNLTLAHRDDGRLLLFAPDHAFTDVTPSAGSPPHSLLTIEDVPDLANWIEVCATAWRHQ